MLDLAARLLRAGLGVMADLFVAGQHAVPARAEAAGYRFQAPTVALALDRLAGPAPGTAPLRNGFLFATVI